MMLTLVLVWNYGADKKVQKPLENTPEIIEKVYKHLRERLLKYREGSTVDEIALKLRIDQYDLYDRAKTDDDFSQTLESLITAMKEDPFKTETLRIAR